MSWAAEELKTASLGDKRRNRRLIKIVEDLSAMPHASVTQAARDEAAVQGTYEFWARKARQQLERALILKWRSPFNKENWQMWGQLFG